MLYQNLSVNTAHHLCFAGMDTVALAEKYGTPLYLMDEDTIRANCQLYKDAMCRAFGAGARPLYASKANAFRRMYEIMREEEMGVDVVSSGEIYTAVCAGYPLENAYFHGNSKTDADIAFAMEHGVGYIVADNREELDAIEASAARLSRHQRVLLRLTPGIDPHTYDAVATGKVDSKFGCAIETGQAEEMTRYALTLPHVELYGFHCHVGSQVFTENVFERAAEIMLSFMADMKKTLGFTARQLDLGGGFGVPYVENDPKPNVTQKIAQVAAVVYEQAAKLGVSVPEIRMEPGRSIVAAAGITLYTVGSVKKIPGYKNYVSVDGGMPDNPRYALYRAAYTCLPAGRMEEERGLICSLVGRCCESGDILQENIRLPDSTQRGDTVAVLTTGAYNYAMASNYNRLPRPPIVMVAGGRDTVAVQRETLADLCRNDL